MCKHRCPQSKEGVGSPGAGVIGGCKLMDMGDGNQAQVICKCSKSSSPSQRNQLPSSPGGWSFSLPGVIDCSVLVPHTGIFDTKVHFPFKTK